MPFDPNQPFEKLDAAPTAGGFDPSKPFEKLDVEPTKPTMPVAKSEGTFDQHIQEISKKYGVSPKSLRDYALDIGSTEAAESPLGKAWAGFKGVEESITMGVPSKLARKALGYIKSPEYEKALDEVTELVQTRKPLLQSGVEFATGLAMPAGALSKATSIGGKAVAGALTGATAGFGASKAGEELQAAGIGAGVGGAIGGAIPAAGRLMQKKGAEIVAESLGEGATKKAREKMIKEGITLEEKGRQLLEKKVPVEKGGKVVVSEKLIPNIFTSVEDVHKKVLEGKQTVGKGISTVLKQVETLEQLTDPKVLRQEGRTLADLLIEKAESLADTPKDRQLRKQLLAEARRYARKKEIPLTQLQETKMALDSRINYDSKRNIDNTLDKQIRDAVRERIDKRVNQFGVYQQLVLGDAHQGLYDKVKQNYRELAEYDKMIANLRARGFKPKEVELLPNLKQTIATVGSAIVGGPVYGTAAYLGGKALEKAATMPGVGKAMYQTGKGITSPLVERATRETIKETQD